MGSKNGHRKDPLYDVGIEAISAEEPDATTFEIILQVMFYEPIKQEKEVMEQLEMTGEEIAKMLHQFKAGGFLPGDCRILWNTRLTKQYLKGL